MTLDEAQAVGRVVAETINKSSHAGCENCQYLANVNLNQTFPQFAWRFSTHDHSTISEVLNGPEV